MTDLDSTEILTADESITENSSTNNAVGSEIVDLINDNWLSFAESIAENHQRIRTDDIRNQQYVFLWKM